MIRWVFNVLKELHEVTEAEFASDFELAESVRRMREAIAPTSLRPILRPTVSGQLFRSEVRLHCSHPFLGAGAGPRFAGSFRLTDSGVVLVGQFRWPTWTQVSLTLWFGFCALGTLAAASLFFGDRPLEGLSCLAGVTMFGLGCSLVRLEQWLTRDDISDISQVIQSALSRSMNDKQVREDV